MSVKCCVLTIIDIIYAVIAPSWPSRRLERECAFRGDTPVGEISSLLFGADALSRHCSMRSLVAAILLLCSCVGALRVTVPPTRRQVLASALSAAALVGPGALPALAKSKSSTHPNMVKVTPSAVPQLGSWASSGLTWRLFAARRSQGRDHWAPPKLPFPRL